MFALAVWILGLSAPQAGGAVPDLSQRLNLFDQMASQIEKLDAEVLEVRSNRPEAWSDTVARLRLEMESARDLKSFVRVMDRLDLAYPNLHCFADYDQEVQNQLESKVQVAATFFSEWLDRDVIRHRIDRVDPSLQGPDAPAVGDELIAINGKPMQDWEREAFLFCKWPLADQCAANLRRDFFSELLGWDRSEPLMYRIRRGAREWDANIPQMPPLAKPPKPSKDCALETGRFPGYRIAYAGRHACVHVSDTDPSTAVLRITSFQYKRSSQVHPIGSVQAEVDALKPFWMLQAGSWKHLVIDVIDNGGGNDPIPYYQILQHGKIQEQYVQFRKSDEIRDPKLRRMMFWDTPSTELWFQKMIRLGIWDRTTEGGFLPPVWAFCADETLPCDESEFDSRPHPFHGRVSVLLNEHCVSSCDGFVWQMATKLGAKLYGRPQAADAAWSRLRINLFPDGQASLSGIYEPSVEGSFMTQTVVVTRTTDAQGKLLDGSPLSLERFVPMTLESRVSWPKSVLDEALATRADGLR